jgi:pimeloyl-ACP methyl ester carboxylesterase
VPHDTAVPTLVLAGQFDPNITPEQSRRVADRIGPKARWVLFAGIGHSVRHFSVCAQKLVAAFIAQPNRRENAACAGASEAFGPAKP